jgi:6,7-dimethyl-8-ribityllumazine synthase
MKELRPSRVSLELSDVKVAVVTARWNNQVTNGLQSGALRALNHHDISADAVEVFPVPGAFELPLATQWVASSGRFDGIIALGCVVRGETPHFDYICAETTRGIGQVGLDQDIPIAFGLLTTDNLQQALSRAGNDAENKGEEAALTVLEMLQLRNQIKGTG